MKSKMNNKKSLTNHIIFCLLIFSMGTSPFFGITGIIQETESKAKKEAPSVFINCADCDLDFIQNQIKFVNHVQSEKDAQVIINIISKELERSGVEYTIKFHGCAQFEGDDDIIKYSSETNAWEELKTGLVETLKMGLMRYAGKCFVAERISVNFMDQVEPTDVEDKWDFWVFSLSANTFLNGEKVYKSGSLYGTISASRVTPELKINFSGGGSYNKNIFSLDDYEIESTSDSKNLKGLIVKSINEHWSIGGYFSVVTSTYSNIDLRINPAPAVEYNFFPYSESTKKQLRLLYRLGYITANYTEETIYEKTHENLWNESLSATLELNQKWGTVSTSVEGAHYFHDFNKYRVVFETDISFRLLKGLNLNFDLYYSLLHDQLSLPRKGASYEEILLRRKELATTYTYYISFGLSYSFGSTQSNVVNPRFGSGGTSIMVSY